MANRLILRDRRGYPWGNVTATIRWIGGGFSKAWVNSSGRGEFGGSGIIDYVEVAGEKIKDIDPSKVDGNTSVVVRSNKNH